LLNPLTSNFTFEPDLTPVATTLFSEFNRRATSIDGASIEGSSLMDSTFNSSLVGLERGAPRQLQLARPSTRCVLWLHEQHNCDKDGSRPSNKDIQVFLLNHYYDALAVMARC
jgi:hypothetical protein